MNARALLSDAKFRATRAVGISASRVARTLARRSRRPLAPGRFTVLTVNWNTLEFLEVLLRGVEQFSPPGTEVIVVDNASRDGSREMLKGMQGRPGLRSVLLPINLGHGPALDLAASLVHTEFFVTLDVDAFPVSPDWLRVLQEHLDAGNRVVGGHMHRGFAHPSMLAMRTADFRGPDHTFLRSSWRSSDSFEHGRSWDVAELISMRERPHVALVEPSEVRGPGVIGTVYGGIVYHNWFSAQGPEERRTEARTAWREAEARFLDAAG